MTIDGEEVTFREGAGWLCSCHWFSEERHCEHVMKAAALATLKDAVKAAGGSGEIQ